jgi:hypothetical protein
MQKVLADGRDALPGPPAFDAIIESVKPDRILGQYLDAYHQAIAMTASQPAGEGEPTKAALKASL